MGRQLLFQEPVFRGVIERCDALIRQLGGWSLWQELTAEESASRMHETSIAQPALFAIQAALAALWESWGIVPDSVVGHSVGEVAAGYIAGVFSLEDAVRVIFHRGRCMDLAPGKGKMLAVGLSLEQGRDIIAPLADRVSIAAINSPTSLSLSGDAEALQEIANQLEQQEVFCRFLQVQYAFHSAQMDPVKDALLESLQGIKPRPAWIPLYSTVTGQRVEGPEWGAEYWWQNVRQTVRFTDAVERLVETNQLTFVELSPHPVLSSAIAECLAKGGHKGKVLPSLRRKEEERVLMLRSLGALWTLGGPVAWEKLVPAEGRLDPVAGLSLATRTLLARARTGPATSVADHRPPPARPVVADPHAFLAEQPGVASVPLFAGPPSSGSGDLSDHSLSGDGPGGRQGRPGRSASVIEEMQLVKACFLSDGQSAILQTVVNPADSSFTICSRTQPGQGKWTTHVRGILRNRLLETPTVVPLEEIRARCPREAQSAECYEKASTAGLEYGPAFQGIQRLWGGRGEAIGQIQAPEAVLGQAGNYQAHPALLDACLQVIFGILLEDSGPRSSLDRRGVYLPVEIEQVRVFGQLGEVAVVPCRTGRDQPPGHRGQPPGLRSQRQVAGGHPGFALPARWRRRPDRSAGGFAL